MRKGYDIILITDGDVRHWHQRPIGPHRLATQLRHKGYTVKVIDFFNRWLGNLENFYKLLDLIIDQDTLFIGFSGTFFNTSTNKDLLSNISSFTDYFKTMSLTTWPLSDNEINSILTKIKFKHPNIKYVYGGERYDYKIKQLSETMDYIVQGFADTTVITLADHLRNNTKINYTLSGSKAKIISYDKDAASFNFREQGYIDFQNEDHMTMNDAMVIETSRGCMFKCSFCGYPILGRKKHIPIYHKSEDTLAYELKKNFDLLGTRNYIIVDNIFNETTEKIQEVLKARDKSKVDIKFNAFIRYEILNKFPEQYGLLKDLGLVAANIGIESLHLPSAKITGKGTDPQKVKDILFQIKQFWNNKISISGSFIIGLPEDNPETLDKWVPWVIDKNCPIDGLFIQRMNLSQLGTTLMNKNPEKYGYTNFSLRRGYDYWKNKYWSSIDADRYMLDVLEKCWSTGRTKVSGIDIIGLQSAGYTFEELIIMPMRDLPFKDLVDKTDQKWQSYLGQIFEYEESRIANRI